MKHTFLLRTKINAAKVVPLMAGLILLLTASVPAGSLLLQDMMEDEVITAKLYPGLDAVSSGRELPIILAVDIEPGWHINSDQPNEDFLIASSISVPEDKQFVLDKVVFPESQEVMTGLSDIPVSIFEDEVLISAVIRVAPGVAPGTYHIPVILDYQACNDDSCLEPRSLESILDIVVAASSTPAKKINQEIFHRLKK